MSSQVFFFFIKIYDLKMTVSKALRITVLAMVVVAGQAFMVRILCRYFSVTIHCTLSVRRVPRVLAAKLLACCRACKLREPRFRSAYMRAPCRWAKDGRCERYFPDNGALDLEQRIVGAHAQIRC